MCVEVSPYAFQVSSPANFKPVEHGKPWDDNLEKTMLACSFRGSWQVPRAPVGAATEDNDMVDHTAHRIQIAQPQAIYQQPLRCHVGSGQRKCTQTLLCPELQLMHISLRERRDA